jgi:hypothetical protein
MVVRGMRRAQSLPAWHDLGPTPSELRMKSIYDGPGCPTRALHLVRGAPHFRLSSRAFQGRVSKRISGAHRFPTTVSLLSGRMEARTGIFRSVPSGTQTRTLHPFQPTRRMPRNISSLVDNLWEWKRPADFACRRHAVYAHPSLEAAQSYDPENNRVYEVVLRGRYRLCQVPGLEDSMLHPDCRALPRLLSKRLGQSWVDAPLQEKRRGPGLLWIPCLSATEVREIFDEVPCLGLIREEVSQAITYWERVVIVPSCTSIPDDRGELFFEPLDGYELSPC